MDETEVAQAAEGDGVELTEIAALNVRRIDGVRKGSNGFPHLIMKGLAPSDTDAGTTADTKRPFPDGTSGPEQPAHQPLTGRHMHLHQAHGGPDANADGLHQHEHEHQGDGDHDHAHGPHDDADDDTGEGAWKSALDGAAKTLAAAAGLDEADLLPAIEDAVKAKLSTAERSNLPDSDFAIPETRDYPIHDENHARNALSRVAENGTASEKARVRAAVHKRYPDIGASDGDAGKSTVAEGGSTVDTVTEGTTDLAKAVEAAVTKATGPLLERIEALGGELAKVKATPVPGGPVLSNVRPGAGDGGGDEWAAKAALYRRKADLATSPADRDGYRQLARECDEKAGKAPPVPPPA